MREWTLLELYTMRDRISFPVYQRGLVWDDQKKRYLIDSIMRGIDIPKLYMELRDGDEWDCIDGHQRIEAILGYFDGAYEYEGRTFEDLSEKGKATFEDYKLSISEVHEIDEEEIRLLFTRLQLGVPLNSGERLNAIKSNLGDFVKSMARHPFIRRASIPSRRFAKEQVCAQICNNSRCLNHSQDFRNSKYEDLEILYRSKADFDLTGNEAIGISQELDTLEGIFGSSASQITNRASVVSIFMWVEELSAQGELDGREEEIKSFYLRFLRAVREEARAGLEATSHFLLSYQSRINQGADTKVAVRERHRMIKEAFEHYVTAGDIIR